jgi:hypothetical protein
MYTNGCIVSAHTRDDTHSMISMRYSLLLAVHVRGLFIINSTQHVIDLTTQS